MCAVPIIATFCSSMAAGWPGSNWRFWSNPFLIVPNAPVITGTIFVLTFHILLTSMFIIIIIIIIIILLTAVSVMSKYKVFYINMTASVV